MPEGRCEWLFYVMSSVVLVDVCRVAAVQRQSFTLISKKGYLYKTGTDRTGWKRRYCCLDQHRGFEYFRTEAVSPSNSTCTPSSL